ncbi:hypothetical protein [Streptomyces melanogenes]|uniref:hypothetical protein n=1 Tax=Streptomyces melanogenes TaxID=67326 RepID=UPI0037A0E631
MMIPHRASDVEETALPPDYQRIPAAPTTTSLPATTASWARLRAADLAPSRTPAFAAWTTT